MADEVTLTIDGRQVTVPAGTLIVDAARAAGVIIPVFCSHPKLRPAGMCRVCLVEIGRPEIDRATGQPRFEEDGVTPVVRFGPKLETSCTTPVSEGIVVLTASEKATAARRETLEFLLTSHPLDCPVCDKGGECPLQNLTLMFGPGESRFAFEDKMHLEKHVPLGDLIFLDRERCIQCGRCIRFQEEIAGDPVIGFYHRGRHTDIVTFSEPGFDSIFSGNTTDICPVGALTTADFRFGARPWEMGQAASLCSHCPVGCNLTYNIRREAKSGGGMVIKRAMARQNEMVNELWLCDKGRLGYHFTESRERLRLPLARKNGALEPVTWAEALDRIAERLRDAGSDWALLAGGRLPNEDLFNLKKLSEALGGEAFLDTYMGGGDLAGWYGLTPGMNLKDLGPGAAILVAGSDLHQEAPLWWLRVKAASERGAALFVVNARPTRLDRYAAHILRCEHGWEAATVESLGARGVAADALREAKSLVIFHGSDGLGLDSSTALANACARLLDDLELRGKPNSGMIGVWHAPNLQGAWDIGFRPVGDLSAALEGIKVAWAVAADSAPGTVKSLRQAAFLIVQDLFLTPAAEVADLVLPAAAYTEREGTFTSGERRVQRFYPVLPGMPGPRADYAIAAQVGRMIGVELEGVSAAEVMRQISHFVPGYAEVSYQTLAQTAPQEPDICRAELFYGGTTYENRLGTGIALPLLESKPPQVIVEAPARLKAGKGELRLYPVTRLYDHGQTIRFTTLLDARRAEAAVWVSPETAASLGWDAGVTVEIDLDEKPYRLVVQLENGIPESAGLIPRDVGVPLNSPTVVKPRVWAAVGTGGADREEEA